MLGRNAVRLIIAKNRFTENALRCCSRDRPRINFLIFSDQECFVVAGSRVARGKTFPGAGNYYRAENIVIVCFEAFALRHPSCFRKDRRSGAQRGASENNFGQRFSVSTPCFCLLNASRAFPRFILHTSPTARSRGCAISEERSYSLCGPCALCG